MAFAAVGLAPTTGAAADDGRVYANLSSPVLLDNERVLVRRVVIAPGEATGRQVAHGEELEVFIHGGVLTSSASGRAVLWRDGRVAWHGAGETPDEGSTNTGSTPIEIVWVTLKPVKTPAPAPGQPPKWRHLGYPNIPGEDLLENDAVIVQRFIVNPGQWEGVHAHHPDMLYIHVRGGQWAARSKHEAEHVYPNRSADGSVGWMATIDIGEGHESGNVGDNPIDLVWVTLKR
jgi:quercetin dioxygenase-like cupin family protein